MNYFIYNQHIKNVLAYFYRLQFVLSGFTQHLASHFGRSSSNHSWRYASSNDQPNCFASYCVNSGSLVKYSGWVQRRSGASISSIHNSHLIFIAIRQHPNFSPVNFIRFELGAQFGITKIHIFIEFWITSILYKLGHKHFLLIDNLPKS